MSRILAEGAEHITVVFGIIAISVFILLGVITWSYRDVANRHDHKSGKSNSHH